MNDRLYPLKEERCNEVVQPLLDQFKASRVRPAHISDDHFFCAVLDVLRSGMPWRDLPQCYGGWHTIYTRLKRWSESGRFWAFASPKTAGGEFQLGRQYDRGGSSAWLRGTKKNGAPSLGRGQKSVSTQIHVGLSPNGRQGAYVSEGQRTDMSLFSQ